MTSTIQRRFCLVSALVIPLMASQAMVFVPADDPNIQYFGRVDVTAPAAPRLSWPGTQIRVRFTGTECRAVLDEGDSSWYNVLLNDSLVRTFLARASSDTYVVAQNLSAGSHDVTLYKRTESELRPVTFRGFLLSDGGAVAALPARTDRRIEIIGDSHSAGLGDEGKTGDWATCTFSANNAWLSYGALAGRYFGADTRITAVSGKGMVNNHSEPGRASATPFPAYFTRTLTNAAVPAWSWSSWIPQVAVINLGTNDVAQCFEDRATIVDESAFVSAYRTFLDSLRTRYPGVKMVLVGPYDVCGCRDSATDLVRRAYQQETGEGAQDVYFRAYRTATSSDYVCCHPGVAFHRELADSLTPLIAQITGWTKTAGAARGKRAGGTPSAAIAFVREAGAAGEVVIRIRGVTRIGALEIHDSTGRLTQRWADVRTNAVSWKCGVPGVYGVTAKLDKDGTIEGRLVVGKAGR